MLIGKKVIYDPLFHIFKPKFDNFVTFFVKIFLNTLTLIG